MHRMASALHPLHGHPASCAPFTFLTSARQADASHRIASSITTCWQRSHIVKLRAAPPETTRKPSFSFKHTAFLSAQSLATLLLPPVATAVGIDPLSSYHQLLQFSTLADLDPSVASLLIQIFGPVLASLNFLFIIRIVMSWYPQLPVDKFPYVVAFAPTEPILGPTRRLIPPVGGVDVSPVIWVALVSFLNEILFGQQGLLVLLSQQQS